jgi:phosphoglycolate phosphatase-like HAD superfamily hydrolase
VIALNCPADDAGSYRPQAVVFDCDGVIADTVAAWNETFVGVGVRHGLTLLPEQLARLRGSAIKPASQLFGRWLGGAASPEKLANELNEQLLLSLGAAQLAPLDGLADLLAKLSGAVPMAVASNAPRRAVLGVLARRAIGRGRWYVRGERGHGPMDNRRSGSRRSGVRGLEAVRPPSRATASYLIW